MKLDNKNELFFELLLRFGRSYVGIVDLTPFIHRCNLPVWYKRKICVVLQYIDSLSLMDVLFKSL